MIYIQSLSKPDEIGEVVFDGRVFPTIFLNDYCVDVANLKSVGLKYSSQRKNVQTRIRSSCIRESVSERT